MFSPDLLPDNSRELLPGLTTFYRFEDERSLVDSNQHLIVMRRFLLERISATGKTAWLRPLQGGGDPLKRMVLSSRKPWAASEIQDAWRLFLDRKRWQLSFIEDQRRRARAVLEAAPRLDPLSVAFAVATPVDLDPFPPVLTFDFP